MADDIVNRLIGFHGLPRCIAADGCVVCEAADEIERLRDAEEARITNLRMLNEANAKLSELRAAGDALAEAHVDDLCDCGQSECVAIRDAHAAWREARRD